MKTNYYRTIKMCSENNAIEYEISALKYPPEFDVLLNKQTKPTLQFHLLLF